MPSLAVAALLLATRANAQAAPVAPVAPAPEPPAAVSEAPAPSAAPALGAPADVSVPAAAAATTDPLLRPLVAPAPPDPAFLLALYEKHTLRRVPAPPSVGALPAPDWAVRDGGGKRLDATTFARRLPDARMERRIAQEARNHRQLATGLAIGGSALALAGLGVIAMRASGAPVWDDYSPARNPSAEALAQAESEYAAAQEAHAIRTTDRLWIGGFLSGAGFLTLGASTFANHAAAARSREPALYWEVDDADLAIAAHNAALRQTLGLPDPNAPARVTVTVPTPLPEQDAPASDDAEPVEVP